MSSETEFSDVIINLVNDIDIIRVARKTAERIQAEVFAHVNQVALLDRLEMIANELANLVLKGD